MTAPQASPVTQGQAPDVSMMSADDLCALMLATGMSSDPSDKAFCKACRDELAKRKPEQCKPAAMRPKATGATR